MDRPSFDLTQLPFGLDRLTYCPFCLWSCSYNTHTDPAALEEVIELHLAEHVEEMCNV